MPAGKIRGRDDRSDHRFRESPRPPQVDATVAAPSNFVPQQRYHEVHVQIMCLGSEALGVTIPWHIVGQAGNRSYIERVVRGDMLATKV